MRLNTSYIYNNWGITIVINYYSPIYFQFIICVLNFIYLFFFFLLLVAVSNFIQLSKSLIYFSVSRKKSQEIRTSGRIGSGTTEVVFFVRSWLYWCLEHWYSPVIVGLLEFWWKVYFSETANASPLAFWMAVIFLICCMKSLCFIIYKKCHCH